MTWTRSTKSPSGSTSYQTDDQLSQTALAEFDGLASLVNGGLKNINIDAAAAIALTKLGTQTAAINPESIDDHAASDAEFLTRTSPGTPDSTSVPTDLSLELQRIRYALERVGIGVGGTAVDRGAGAQYDDGVNVFNAGWVMEPARGANQILNGTFSVGVDSDSTDFATYPAALWWVEVGSPGTHALRQVGADNVEDAGQSINIVGTIIGDGIQQTIAGLRASHRYLVKARVKPTTTQCRLVTTGADAASNYVDLSSNGDIISASGSGAWETLLGIIQTDATPTDIVVQILCVQATSEFDVKKVEVLDLDDDVQTPHLFADRQEYAPGGVVAVPNGFTEVTATAIAAGTGALKIAVMPPKPGCVIQVFGSVSGEDPSGGSDYVGARITENTVLVSSGGAISPTQSTSDFSGVVQYTNRNPTPGTTVTYAIETADAGSGANFSTVTGASYIEVLMWVP